MREHTVSAEESTHNQNTAIWYLKREVERLEKEQSK